MFNKIVIQGGGGQNHSHTHIEKRAPTDESVRLMNEFKEKAMDSIISDYAVHIPSLKIDGVVIRSILPPANSFGYSFLFIYNLNGKEMQHTLRLSGLDVLYVSKGELISKIYELLAKDIAIELMKAGLDAELRTIFK